jgi:CheY-like chemotaxis protein
LRLSQNPHDLLFIPPTFFHFVLSFIWDKTTFS